MLTIVFEGLWVFFYLCFHQFREIHQVAEARGHQRVGKTTDSPMWIRPPSDSRCSYDVTPSSSPYIGLHRAAPRPESQLRLKQHDVDHR